MVDDILWETASGENYQSFPVLKGRIEAFLTSSLKELSVKSVDEIIAHRYKKFRDLGQFKLLDEAGRVAAVQEAIEKKIPRRSPQSPTRFRPNFWNT